MKRSAVLLVMVLLCALPARAETGTWGVSGTADLLPASGGPRLFMRLNISAGLTETGRPGVGYASLTGGALPVEIVIACATTQVGADRSWRFIGYGLGSDSGGWRIDLSLDRDLAASALTVGRGAPDSCDVSGPMQAWTGMNERFAAGEGGGVHLTGSATTAPGTGLAADIVVIPFTSPGLGSMDLNSGNVTQRLEALCVVMSTPRPRAVWYQVLARSGDGVVYDIHIGDEDRTATTGDTIAVETVDPSGARAGCSAGSSATPQPVSAGNFVTHDLL